MKEETQTGNIPSSSIKKQFTPQQQKALALDRNMSVTAGAGSGKTSILVERYLKIVLEENVDIRQVLAITFTEKAAAEMTERLARMINESLLQPENSDRYTKLLALRERLNSAQISTIHAFCARILREFAVASETDPDFSVLTEFQQQLLINEAVEEVLGELDTEKLESPYDFREWKELLRQIPPEVVRQTISTALTKPYEMQQFRERLDSSTDETLFAELKRTFFTVLEKHLDPEQFVRRVWPLLQQLNSASVTLASLKENGRQVFELIERILALKNDSVYNPQGWHYLMDLSRRITNRGIPYKSLTALGTKKDLDEAYDLLFQLSERLSPLGLFCENHFPAAPSRYDRLHFQALRKLLFLYQQAEAKYRQLKEERGMVDFDDLQILSLKMLKTHPVVQNTLRNRYRYIMVDEFQDTNQLQWEIIALLGMLEGQLQKDKFFVVGDPKQSIYGFRDADVRVFEQVKADFAGGKGDSASYSGNLVLGDSFRFLPSLNRFINHLFEKIFQHDPTNEFEVSYGSLTTRRDLPGDAGYLEIALINDEEARAAGYSQEDYLAQTIHKLLTERISVYHQSGETETLRPIRPGDIAVLIPRRTHLLEMEAKFRQYGIPFKTIGGVGFYRRQEVFDVYHLMRFLSNPDDDVALIGLLRSPLAGISDAALFHLAAEKRRHESYRKRLANIVDFSIFPRADRKPLQRFREQLFRWEHRRDRLSLTKLLNEIFEESFYRATVAAEWNGEQLLANLDKIVSLAREYEQGGFMAFSDFIEALHDLIHQDPREGEGQIALEDQGTVKIMTIHQAKGLEFPVVLCPYLQQIPRSDLRKMRLDSDFGLAVRIRDPEDHYTEVRPFLYEWINYRQKRKQRAELKRLLYVAVTRARDRLYLAGTYTKNELQRENCLAWTAGALDIDPQAGDSVAEKSLTIAGNLKIHLVLKAAPQELRPPGYQEVQKSLKTLQQPLRTPKSAVSYLPPYLVPINDTPRGATFSATQLLTFQADPETYFRRYHLGFFESDYEFIKQISDPDNMSLLKGKIVHAILEDGIPPDNTVMTEKLEQLFFQYEIFDEQQQAELKQEIPPLIGSFSGSPFAKKIFSARDFKTEISLSMRLGNDYVTGTLDRIFSNRNGQWEVADYKTNRITEKEVQKTGKKYLMQMRAYAMLLAQLFPDQQVYPVTLYFLVPQKEYWLDFSALQVEAIKGDFLKLIGQIKEYYPFGDRLLDEDSRPI